MLGFSQGKDFLPCVMKDDPVQSGWQTLRCAGLKHCGFSVCIFELPSLCPSQVSLLFSWKACTFLCNKKTPWKARLNNPLDCKRQNPFGHQWNSWRNWITREIKAISHYLLSSSCPVPSKLCSSRRGLSRTSRDLFKCFALWTLQVHHCKLPVQMKSQQDKES